MEDVLYLCHRIPYPPNKGDKIRSYNILKYLAGRYRVHLATFVDDDDDIKYIKTLKEYCVDVKAVTINPFLRKLFSLTALMVGDPLSNQFYRAPEISSWVKEKVVSEGVKSAVAFSSPMAQFLRNDECFEKMTRIMDFVDVDSEKWAQYAVQKSGALAWLYGYESRKLREYETRICNEFECSSFVSKQEADLFKEIVPELRDKVTDISNGVNTDFFDPEVELVNPYTDLETPERDNTKVLVFTGAMDYWANVDAVCWFAENCFPEIKSKVPDACFYIVGIRPDEKVKSLSKREGIIVTGAVEDVRPYVKYSAGVIAPLRIARGIQNKVLEALSMAKSVVATSEAMEGIDEAGTLAESVATNAREFTDKCLSLLNRSPDANYLPENREFVMENFSWETHLQKFDSILRVRKQNQIPDDVS